MLRTGSVKWLFELPHPDDLEEGRVLGHREREGAVLLLRVKSSHERSGRRAGDDEVISRRRRVLHRDRNGLALNLECRDRRHVDLRKNADVGQRDRRRGREVEGRG